MKRNCFVTNNSPAPKAVDKIQAFVVNFIPSLTRVETLEGREHTVVPMVILTEGVHAGSSGPMYYPKEELSKTPEIWNHRPIVVYHPEMNGRGISACDPIVLNNRKVGIMLNTKFENGKLKSEAWLEKDRANKIDERIFTAITANEMMEVSTGLFTDAEDAPGKWKGQDYSVVARNFRPDHLALLPDQIGACSIAKGAGLCRNAEEPPFQKELSQALKTKINDKVVVVNVCSNFVIYESDGKSFRLGYTGNDTGVSLSNETPVEVKRVTEYRTVEGAFVGNQDQQKKNDHMKKKKLVDALIENKDSGWLEEDRKTLEALSEEKLEHITPKVKAPEVPAPVVNKEKPADVPAPVASPVAPVVVNKEIPKVLTVDEYINQAPPAVQEVLRNSTQLLNEEKARLIATIVANKNNRFTEESLKSRPLNELRDIAALAAPVDQQPFNRQADYSGQAPVTGNQHVEEALALPVMNFSK